MVRPKATRSRGLTTVGIGSSGKKENAGGPKLRSAGENIRRCAASDQPRDSFLIFASAAGSGNRATTCLYSSTAVVLLPASSSSSAFE